MPGGTGNRVCGPTFATRYEADGGRVSADPTLIQHIAQRALGTNLSKHPPIHEEARAVRQSVVGLELEAQQYVRVLREVEVEGGDEEADAGSAARKTL